MNREEILAHLAKLVHLDIDATQAYDQAIRSIDEQVIKDKLILFKGDHRKHLELISAKMLEMGGRPPEFASDFKGFFITGFTALRSMTGIRGTLHAMESNEKLTVSKYEEASIWDMPSDIAAIIRTNLADEQHHLSFIREAIAMVGKG